MAIDKESNGMPQVDFSRQTTRVNLWMIIAIAVFILIGAYLALHYAGKV